MKQPAKEIDLHEYDNPIKRVDGQVPYNGYLWPTEAWWPGHQPEFRNRIHGQWHFGIVALIDGRFAVDGTVSYIEANSETPYRRENEPEGRRVDRCRASGYPGTGVGELGTLKLGHDTAQ